VRAEALEGLSKTGTYTRIMVSDKVYALTRGLYDYVKAADRDVYEVTGRAGGKA